MWFFLAVEHLSKKSNYQQLNVNSPANNCYKMAEAKNRSGIILFCAVILSLLVYGYVYQVKLMPTGDETIAYLCATGNQGLYEQVNKQGGLYGKISGVEDWQSFFTIKQGAFERIAPDLVQTDLHPPLYFWTLHLVLQYIQP
ncbi:MAG: hypothetical protein EAY81_06775, partial [Bacteroidetes bacterium]